MTTTTNSIIFKATKEGLIILLDPDLAFEALCEDLAHKVKQSKNFFGDTKTTISFKGREITSKEETHLVNIIRKESDLEIVLGSISLPKPPTAKALKPKEKEREKPKQKLRSPFPTNLSELTATSANHNDTKFREGSVRSGQIERYTGSIVIMGDVNPGAEVRAYGNVIVLGAIKGLVHAGYPASYDCYIAALEINTAQIRIADLITYISPENVHNTAMPSKVYTQDKRIVIEPIR